MYLLYDCMNVNVIQKYNDCDRHVWTFFAFFEKRRSSIYIFVLISVFFNK